MSPKAAPDYEGLTHAARALAQAEIGNDLSALDRELEELINGTPGRQMPKRDYLVRADGEFVRNRAGRLIKFTFAGAHRWAQRHTPQSYTVVKQVR